jgi:hypothetical protein
MGYMHIENLYKCQDILLFRECYALEKLHGTSASLIWKNAMVEYFPGGESLVKFMSIFDDMQLKDRFRAVGHPEVSIFGEAYGGKCQGMSETYGGAMKFAVFDVKVGDNWLAVPDMADIAKQLGLEVVHYERIKTDLVAIDAQRDAPSIQAIRNGAGERKREGVVLRPLIEVLTNDGRRVIAKHKREDFSERKTPQAVQDPAKLKVLEDAKAIADEWVTPMRLQHVLDKLPRGIGVEETRTVVEAMLEDVRREAKGEIVDSKEATRAIGRRAAELFKEYVKTAAFQGK